MESLARVFICHASEDAELAMKICAQLEGAGLPCWIAPRDVGPGARYAPQLVSAIESCDAFLLLLTHASASSDHVAREVEQAAHHRKRLVPVVVNGAVSHELSYYISNIHQIVGNEAEVVTLVNDYFRRSTSSNMPQSRRLQMDQPKELKVGVIPFPPFASHASAADGPSGFYVDLLRRYGMRSEVAITFEEITNDRTVSALDSGDIDVVACLYRTPRRSQRFSFAACFYASSVTAVVPSSNSKVNSQRDLLSDEVKIAVCKGEVGSEIAQDQFRAAVGSRRLIEIDSVDVKAIAGMVASGVADVAITDTVTCQMIVRSSRGFLQEAFTRRPLFVGHIGLVLPKRSQELAIKLDVELASIRDTEDMQRHESAMFEEYPDLVELL